MSDEAPSSSPLADVGDSDRAMADREPTFRAQIVLLAPQVTWKSIVHDVVPNRIDVIVVETVDEYAEELSGNVAVSLLPATLPRERLRGLARYSLQRSPHIQLIAYGENVSEGEKEKLPVDDYYSRDSDRDLKAVLKRMYFRAYYSATLARIYQINITLVSRKHATPTAETGDDPEPKKLEDAAELLQSYLTRFRSHLDQRDIEDLRGRNTFVREVNGTSKSRFDPAVWNLPRSCPNCDLDWTVYHGPRLGQGYENIGANTWRCTRCSEVITTPADGGLDVI